MKKFLLSLILLAGFSIAPVLAQAACFGSGNYYNCNDNHGNSYNVNKFGNTTIVNGHNARTGSSWNATTNNFGNTSITKGRAANGNTWNSTTNTFGNTTITNGHDSNGNSFRKTCIGDYCY